jgi:transcriptional regulator with XRE-family HTH domain
MLDKFAEELKRARQSCEITLQQIAAKTRIDLKFLEALENGNFSFLPDLYVKAFIREYSKMVGLEPEETVEKFEAAKKGKNFGTAETSEEIKEENKEAGEQKEKSAPPPKPKQAAPVHKSYESEPGRNGSADSSSNINKKKLALAGGIVGVIILAVVIYFGFIQGSSDIIVKEKPIEQIIKENQHRYEEEPTAAAAADTVKSTPAPRNLILTMEASDTTWIKVMIDDGLTEEFTLMPGSKKEIAASSNFKMIVGSAGALNLSLNNKQLNLKGDKHEVRYLSIDASGMSYLKDLPNFTR